MATLDAAAERELRDGFFASSAPERGLYGRRRLEFTVIGLPQTKGSTRAFAIPAKDHTTGGPLMKHTIDRSSGQVVAAPVYRAVTTSDNPKLKDWQHAVATGASRALDQLPELERQVFAGAVAIDLTFELPRPQSLPKKTHAHLKKPDLDKLIRAVKDALTAVLWRDDSQVVEIRARKRYADPTTPARVFVAVEG